MKRICIAIATFLFTSFAFAADVGIASSGAPGADFIRLTDEAKTHCTQGSKRAVYVVGKHENSIRADKVGFEIEGCWLYVDGAIAVEFSDGDSGSFPITLVTWANGFKPKAPTI